MARDLLEHLAPGRIAVEGAAHGDLPHERGPCRVGSRIRVRVLCAHASTVLRRGRKSEPPSGV